MTATATVHRLGGVGERVGPLTLARDRTLAVDAVWAEALPEGLVRGTTVAVCGSAGVSAALALVAGATRSGSWLAVIGSPWLGWAAAGEAGAALGRMVQVSPTFDGREAPERWAEVVAALLDGFDVVLASPDHRVREVESRRLATRARRQGSVLIGLAAPWSGAGVTEGKAWPPSPDLWCQADGHWQGLGDGHGHLASRSVHVEIGGRRRPRPQRLDLWLPAADGTIAEVHRSPRPSPDRKRGAAPGPAAPAAEAPMEGVA